MLAKHDGEERAARKADELQTERNASAANQPHVPECPVSTLTTVFLMVLGLFDHWHQWFSMVKDQGLKDGMVSMDRHTLTYSTTVLHPSEMAFCSHLTGVLGRDASTNSNLPV